MPALLVLSSIFASGCGAGAAQRAVTDRPPSARARASSDTGSTGRSATRRAGTVVLRLGCETIRAEDVERVRARVARIAGVEPSREDALELLVRERLVARDAATHALAVSDADVERAIDTIRARADLDPAQLAGALGERGLTLADYRDEVRQMLLGARVAQVVARPLVTGEEVERVYAERVGEEGPFEAEELADVHAELVRARMERALSERYGRMRSILERARLRRGADGEAACSEVLPTVAVDDVHVAGLTVVPTGTWRAWLAAEADGAGDLQLDAAGELHGAALARLEAELDEAGFLASEIEQHFDGAGSLEIVVREGPVHHVREALAVVQLPDGSTEDLDSPLAPRAGATLVRSEVDRWIRDLAGRAAARLGVDASLLGVRPESAVSRDHGVSLRVAIARREPTATSAR